MLSCKDKAKILDYAKKYNLRKVILFGSSVNRKNSGDIDLGIKGIKSGEFFDFYGNLMLSLSKRVDVIDLNKKNAFNKLVEKEGIKLYEQVNR